MRTTNLIARFYRGIFLANFLVTLSCLYLIWFYGDKAHKIIAVLFWYKAIALGLIFYTAIYYNKNQLYYYQSLGVSKLMLAITTSVFDFLIFLTLIIILY